jgi:hypothetical protein
MSGRYSYVGNHPGRTKRSRVLYSLYCVRQRAPSTGGRERPAASGVGIKRPDAARHGVHHRARRRPLRFSRRRYCGSRTSIWAVFGDWLIQYRERERHSSRGAKAGLLFGQIQVPSLRQVEVQLHELQVLLLLPSLPRAAILLVVH